MTKQRPTVERLIAQSRRHLVRAELQQQGLNALVIAVAVAVLFVIADHRFFFDKVGRSIFWCLMLPPGMWLIMRAWITNTERRLSDLYIARALEQKHPRLKNALVSYLQRAHDDPVRQALAQQILADPPALSIDSRPRQRRVKVLLFFVASMAYYAFASSQPTMLSLQRVLLPWKSTRMPSATRLVSVAPANRATVVVDKIWTIDIKTAGHPPSAGHVEYRTDGDDWARLPVHRFGDDHHFVCEMPPVSGELDYVVTIGDAISPVQRLNAIPRPVIESQAFRVAYPPYLDLPVQTVTNDIEAVRGSTLTLDLETDPPLAKAVLSWNGDEQLLNVSGRRVRTFRPVRLNEHAVFHILMWPDLSVEPTKSRSWSVTLQPDEKPVCKLNSPTSDVLLPATSTLPFDLQLTDDFGLKSAALVFQHFGRDDEIVIALDLPKTRKFEQVIDWVPRRHGVSAGARLVAYVRCRDHYPQRSASYSKSIIVQISEGVPIAESTRSPSPASEDTDTSASSSPPENPVTSEQPVETSDVAAEQPEQPVAEATGESETQPAESDAPASERPHDVPKTTDEQEDELAAADEPPPSEDEVLTPASAFGPQEPQQPKTGNENDGEKGDSSGLPFGSSGDEGDAEPIIPNRNTAANDSEPTPGTEDDAMADENVTAAQNSEKGDETAANEAKPKPGASPEDGKPGEGKSGEGKSDESQDGAGGTGDAEGAESASAEQEKEGAGARPEEASQSSEQAGAGSGPGGGSAAGGGAEANAQAGDASGPPQTGGAGTPGAGGGPAQGQASSAGATDSTMPSAGEATNTEGAVAEESGANGEPVAARPGAPKKDGVPQDGVVKAGAGQGGGGQEQPGNDAPAEGRAAGPTPIANGTVKAANEQDAGTAADKTPAGERGEAVAMGQGEQPPASESTADDEESDPAPTASRFEGLKPRTGVDDLAASPPPGQTELPTPEPTDESDNEPTEPEHTTPASFSAEAITMTAEQDETALATSKSDETLRFERRPLTADEEDLVESFKSTLDRLLEDKKIVR